MSQLKIGIILGSTRPGRNASAVAQWVMDRVSVRDDAQYELVDLTDFALGNLDEAVPASMGQYAGAHTQAWAAKIASFDGFIFVTPEYNHSITGALKNALDYVFAEWNNKAAGIVSFGSIGGARAAEHLRQILGELMVADVRQQVMFTFANDFASFTEFAPQPAADAALDTLVQQVLSWSGALKGVREGAVAAA